MTFRKLSAKGSVTVISIFFLLEIDRRWIQKLASLDREKTGKSNAHIYFPSHSLLQVPWEHQAWQGFPIFFAWKLPSYFCFHNKVSPGVSSGIILHAYRIKTFNLTSGFDFVFVLFSSWLLNFGIGRGEICVPVKMAFCLENAIAENLIISPHKSRVCCCWLSQVHQF